MSDGRPDFLLIGAAKAGTTAVTNWLRARNDVFVPRLDEVNFWAYDPERLGELRWGSTPERHWPVTDAEAYRCLFRRAPSGAVRGECSVVYLESKIACDQIAASLPDVKLIVILRDPVVRAISGFHMATRNGWTDDSWTEAFAPDKDRVKTGEYHRLLAPYVDAFSRSQLLVLDHAELSTDPASACRKIEDFLGLEHRGDNQIPSANVGGRVRHQRLYDLTRNRHMVRLGSRWRGSPAHRLAQRARSSTMTTAEPPPDGLVNELARHYARMLPDLRELLGQDDLGQSWTRP